MNDMTWDKLIELCTRSALIKEDLKRLSIRHERFLEAVIALRELQLTNNGKDDPSFFLPSLPNDLATRNYVDWIADVENTIRTYLYKLVFVETSITSLRAYRGYKRFISNLCSSQGMMEQLYGTMFIRSSEDAGLKILNIEETSPEADVSSRIGDEKIDFHITGGHSKIGYNHFRFFSALRMDPLESTLRNMTGERFYILPSTRGSLPIAQPGRPIFLKQIIFNNEDTQGIAEEIPFANSIEFMETLGNRVMTHVAGYLEHSLNLESATIIVDTQKSDRNKQRVEYSYTIFFSNVFGQYRVGSSSPTSTFKFLAEQIRRKEAKLTDKARTNILIYTLEGRGSLDEGIDREIHQIEGDIGGLSHFDAVVFLNTTFLSNNSGVSIKRSRFFATQKTKPDLIGRLEPVIKIEALLGGKAIPSG